MQRSKITGSILVLVSIMVGVTSCSSSSPDDSAQMKKEIEAIDTLLRDPTFTAYMARSLDAAYYAGNGQAQPPFLIEKDAAAVQLVRVKDEKVATSIAGFYALECAVELLSKNSGETFVSWLEKITKGEAGSAAMLLLNRFANATWKAGQPFRDMERLQRYNFRVAALLSKEEVDKDSIQIVKAAGKLLSEMVPVAKGTQEEQMKLLRTLLQDTSFAAKIASYSNSAFAVSKHQTPGTSSTPGADTATTKKTVRQMKIATGIAGFYALECGLNYLVTTKHVLPSVILQSLVNDQLSKDELMLFARFANATWKAGQPFRGLQRITRKTFTPFYFLSESDIDKDVVQIKAAGKILLASMKSFPK